MAGLLNFVEFEVLRGMTQDDVVDLIVSLTDSRAARSLLKQEWESLTGNQLDLPGYRALMSRD